ncbi:MAG TPA: twin-arginine translocase TatA/TatE family subunit [Planctomycetota bacterium]|jgi:sec-independent protein translocase protein TatA|nr:twin-arginine translocase TatA/TatE family subunit [Planctomycetota bacterium]
MSPALGAIGLLEAALIAFAIVLLFASSRIPALMRGLGAGLHEFKKGIREGSGQNGPTAPPKA